MKIITLKDGTEIKVKAGRMVDIREAWVAIIEREEYNTEMLIPLSNIQHIKTEE